MNILLSGLPDTTGTRAAVTRPPKLWKVMGAFMLNGVVVTSGANGSVTLWWDLYDVVALGLQEAYANGKERGQSLLMQLASGDMSAEQFNKATLKPKDR